MNGRALLTRNYIGPYADKPDHADSRAEFTQCLVGEGAGG